MKRNKRIRIFMIMSVSLWILLFPAYLHFYDLEEADFFSPNQIWENPDSEILLAGFEKKGKFLGTGIFSITFFLWIILCEWLPRFSGQTFLPPEPALVLRC
jgi:hypothetical protein